MLVKDVKKYLDERFPIENACEFDQNCVGLCVGNENCEVSNILLSLDLNLDVLNDAISKNCNLIITHHPFLFNHIQKVLFNTEKGHIIELMAKNNISLYSMHTNLDVAKGGVNDILADMLGIKDIKIINNEASKDNFLRYGNINEVSLKELALKVKDTFKLSGVRVLGDLDKKIRTIGVVGGSGAHNSDIYNAIKCGCDCYITGEVHLNNNQFADYYGLSLIEVNHGVEKFVFNYLIKEFKDKFKKLYNFNNEIIITSIETDKMITL